MQEEGMESWSEEEKIKISRCKATGPDNSEEDDVEITLEGSDKSDEDYVEITLEVRDESISTTKAKATLRSVLSGRLKTMVKTLSFASRRLDRSKSSGAMFALRGLRFIAKTDAVGRGWDEVAKRFDQLAVEGKLPKSKFGHCIGEKSLNNILFGFLILFLVITLQCNAHLISHIILYICYLLT